MIGEESWEDYHHHSHLPDDINDYSNELNHPSVVNFLANSVFIDTIESERNLSNIEETISINISINVSTKPNIVENIHVSKSCSPLEIDNYHALFPKFRDIFARSYEKMPAFTVVLLNMKSKCTLMSSQFDRGFNLFIQRKLLQLK